jgi:hypothetical protein
MEIAAGDWSAEFSIGNSVDLAKKPKLVSAIAAMAARYIDFRMGVSSGPSCRLKRREFAGFAFSLLRPSIELFETRLYHASKFGQPYVPAPSMEQRSAKFLL